MAVHILGLQLQDSALSIAAVHRRRTLSVLTRVQSVSAAALTAFGVVHLSAPLVGLLHLGIGDVNERVDAVSSWMLLGRVAYQSGVGEALLWTSLVTHLFTGVAKRIVTRFTIARPKAKTDHVPQSTQVESNKPHTTTPVFETNQTRLSIAQLSGYILTPFAVHHTLINRWIPSWRTAPISGLSPSELDYSFVSHTLSHSNLAVRTVMGVTYTLLIGAFAIHATYALPTLLRSLPKSARTTRSTKSPRSQAQSAATLTAVLLASLIAIVPLKSNNRLTISGALKTRYDAVLQMAWPTSIFLHPRPS